MKFSPWLNNWIGHVVVMQTHFASQTNDDFQNRRSALHSGNWHTMEDTVTKQRGWFTPQAAKKGQEKPCSPLGSPLPPGHTCDLAENEEAKHAMFEMHDGNKMHHKNQPKFEGRGTPLDPAQVPHIFELHVALMHCDTLNEVSDKVEPNALDHFNHSRLDEEVEGRGGIECMIDDKDFGKSCLHAVSCRLEICMHKNLWWSLDTEHGDWTIECIKTKMIKALSPTCDEEDFDNKEHHQDKKLNAATGWWEG